MGRLQTFDSSVVVQAARDLFWDRGYEAVSLADLEAATGVGRSSLYHAFGSKRGLFDAAVTDYLDTVIRPRLAVLRSGATDAGALLRYFDGLAEVAEAYTADSPRRGCLLVNCAAGLAGQDGRAREVVEAYRLELTDALRYALSAASPGGPEAASPNADSPADDGLLEERVRTLSSLSISAMLLARVNRDESVALLTTAANQVRSWLPDRAA